MEGERKGVVNERAERGRERGGERQGWEGSNKAKDDSLLLLSGTKITILIGISERKRERGNKYSCIWKQQYFCVGSRKLHNHTNTQTQIHTQHHHMQIT